jgi:Gpi18-like mannosyltransferase
MISRPSFGRCMHKSCIRSSNDSLKMDLRALLRVMIIYIVMSCANVRAAYAARMMCVKDSLELCLDHTGSPKEQIRA